MGTLKIETDDKLLDAFKRKSMEVYGYRKGAFKFAIENLIKRWVIKKDVNWGLLKGKLKSKKTAVELQHNIWKGVD